MTTKLEQFAAASKPYADAILEACDKYSINTPLRLCHWLAQVATETQDFHKFEESLSYSAPRLLAVFPKYFKNLEEAEKFVGKPIKIAERVYGGRMGNGPEGSGDGYKYRGRSAIHTTGKDNYAATSKALFGDNRLISNPDLLLAPGPSMAAGGWYFASKGCLELADSDNITEITRRVNGGLNSFRDRVARLNKAKKLFLNA